MPNIKHKTLLEKGRRRIKTKHQKMKHSKKNAKINQK